MPTNTNTKGAMLTMRLTPALSARLEAAGVELSARIPGVAWSRSAVVRFLLEKGLEAAELGAPDDREDPRAEG